MAPKRPSPLDEPPAASSSEEVEEASSEEEEEEEDPSEDEQEANPKKAATSTVASKPQDSESDEGSSSDSDAEDSPVKPIASKPMEETASPAAKSKKARSKPATPAKRLAFSEPAKGSKRAKKKSSDGAGEAESDGAAEAAVEDEPKKSGGGDEKKLFQRLWSEEDEIVILKGITDYTAKRGLDPLMDIGAFHDFIRKSLHIDVLTTQLKDKIRRLKKKYANNSAKKKYEPTKVHEKKAFELSKKIWGGSGSGDEPKSNGTPARTASRSNGKTPASRKAERLPSPDPAMEAEEVAIDGNGGSSAIEVFGFDKSLPEYVVRQGLELISEEKKAELESKWKKIHVAELELLVKRNQLMIEQGKLILDALKSSDR